MFEPYNELRKRRQGAEVTSGITADSGSVQGGGVLTTIVNQVTVSGTAGDAVTLPSLFKIGDRVYVKNDAAVNAIDIFPALGHDLGAGANTAVSLAAGVGAMFCGIAENATWAQMI